MVLFKKMVRVICGAVPGGSLGNRYRQEIILADFEIHP